MEGWIAQRIASLHVLKPCEPARKRNYLYSREIPVWVDGALRKAVHPNSGERYGELSGFVHDLHHPNTAFPGRKILHCSNAVRLLSGKAFH